MSYGTWKGALGRGLAYLGNYNSKGAFDFSYKWKIPFWKVKTMGGLLSVLWQLCWKWQLRGNFREVSCTWGKWVFHWFMHSKKIYEPRETFRILLLPKITPLLTKPLLPYYPFGIPRAWTMGYKENTYFAGFLMAFLLEIWTYILVFPYVRQGPLLKASKGHIKVLGPWCSSCCIFSNWDPCCMFSGLTGKLFFFHYYYYFFLFPSF